MSELDTLQKLLEAERQARQAAEAELVKVQEDLTLAHQENKLLKKHFRQSVIDSTANLQAHINRFRNFVESANDIIYQTDLDGNFTYANPVAVHKIGLESREQIIGRNFLELVHRDEYGKLTEFYEQQLAEREPNTYQEFRLNTADDKQVWLGQNVQLIIKEGKVVGFQAVARDITDRKQIENELQRQRDFAQLVLNSMGQGLTIVNTENRFEYVNPAYAQMMGYEAEELVGKTPFDFTHPDDAAELNTVRQHREAGATSTYETRLLHKEGHFVYVLITGVPLWLNGERAGSIAVITDLTERILMEDELKQTRDQALAVSKLKSEFLANMSHEIRTPLNGVIGIVQLLAETALSAEQEEYVEVISTSGDALLGIVNDVLDFSKISEGKLDLEYHPLKLRAVVESSLDIVAPRAAQKRVDLAYVMEPEVPSMIEGDVVRLRQILVNLLNNAVKFTSKGEVVVSVKTLHHEDGREQLHFAVRDTGIGIPAAHMGRLFQAFSQVDASTTRKYGGTGLGLAICKQLTELMGGDIWVESVEGKGSTFHFTIDAHTPENYVTNKLPELTELAGLRLLIVDDNETNRFILTRQAEMWGMLPCAAASAAVALAWLQEGRPFDIAVLDMQMPEMDGYSLAVAIRQLPAYDHMPLIMLSSIGYKPAHRAQELFAKHATKPIKPLALQKVLLTVVYEYFLLAPQTKSKSPKNQVPQRPLRILLAEDNQINQQVALGLLRQMGQEAQVVTNGAEVLAALEQAPYDVILMDIQMPQMDGVVATQQIRAQGTEIQQPHIIAMTANAVKGDRERFLEAGMDAYLGKPFKFDALRELLVQAEAQLEEAAHL